MKSSGASNTVGPSPRHWAHGAALLLAGSCLLLLLFSYAPAAQAGPPSFGSLEPIGSGAADTSSLAAGDLDGDGDLDVAVGNHGQQNAAYLNDGSGAFDWPGSNRDVGPGTDATEALALGDVDGDGDLDLITGNRSEQNLIYLNDGTAHFYTGTVDCAAPPANVRCFGTGTDSTVALAVADVDADGDLDIAVGNDGEQNVVYLNDGAGNYDGPGAARPYGSGSDPTASVAVGDMDGDGSIDLVVGTHHPVEGQNMVYLNDGAGNFDWAGCERPFGPGNDPTEVVVVGDVDADGDLDVAVGNSDFAFPNCGTQNAVYRNDGSANFGQVSLLPAWDCTYSLTLGDMDGDGDLDLAAGNMEMSEGRQNTFHLNNGSGSFNNSHDFGPGTDRSHSLALGDMNSDSALDILVGNWGQMNALYLNDQSGNHPPSAPLGLGFIDDLALGDLDGDGDLDAVLCGSSIPSHTGNAVYWNDGSGAFPDPSLLFGPGTSYSLAVGDLDGDGDLDVANGRSGPNIVFLNDGTGGYYTGTVDCGAPPSGTRCFGDGNTHDLALGDLDGDGDLDIAAGNGNGQSAVYLNDGTAHFDIVRPIGPGGENTRSVALGDVDGDGDLDVVLGNRNQQNTLYLNDGAGHFETVRRVGPDWDATYAIVLADLNGDGALDIAVGNKEQPNAAYLNDGGGNYDWDGSARNFGTGFDNTEALAAGDIDGDGDIDLLVGNSTTFEACEENRIYLNDGTGGFAAFRELKDQDCTESAAIGDMNGDGTMDAVTASAGDWIPHSGHVHPSRIRQPERMGDTPPHLVIVRPGSVPDAPLYSSPEILENTTIPITYTLFDPEDQPIRFIHTSYSPDGGGRWLRAIAASGTITANLAASTGGTSHTFIWDTFESGFFGQSDNVVFRIEAYPSLQPYTGTVPGPYQWPYAAAETLPFRVRGSQVRVFSGTTPISGAIVYRIPAGQSFGSPVADGAGRPFRTDGLGYLQGRGELNPGDRLVALLPITATEAYTLYVTSAAPTAAGLQAYTMTNPGVQTLTLSPDNPLVLFNLEVSLEWDARTDGQFMEQLRFDLQRTAEYLYDWTNGQAALGRVRVYQDRGQWLDAHLRVYASNRIRPSAAQGGVVSAILTDTDVLTLTYAPGQVQMGAVWNRYGDPGGGIGEDWPRTLAHELGHYLFFLDDNYLGLDEQGRLIPVEGCPGAMSDPYREDYPYDEFHPAAGWLPACEQTLSHLSTGRADWETVSTYYPELASYGTITNSGPAGLPLAVTRIEAVEPLTPPTALEDPTFYLVQDGGRVQPGARARAVLYQGDRLIDLGRPVLDYVLARGASPGDRLCVYELSAGRLGCEEVVENDESLELVSMAAWQPDLILSPVSSMTIALSVTNVSPGLELWARLYPLNDPAPPAVLLSENSGGYSATLQAEAPALSGYVQLWVEEAEPRREIVTDYALGGNPGTIRGRWGTIRGRWGTIRGRWAPAVSADGQVIIFGEGLDFQEGEFYTLQAATVLPTPPPWVTVVGQAYRLAASADAPDLSEASISLSYMGNEVPPGEEEWLQLYHWDGIIWQRLPTQLDLYHNHAAAPTQGEGLYVLMSSIAIPLEPGWNLFAYPVAETRPVTETLRSIEGSYGAVYGYDPALPADPWQVYGADVPDWVNDLEACQFGRGYWITTTEAVTLYLRGASEYRGEAGFPFPPATYYGTVAGSTGFTPMPGMTVRAWVEDALCGEAQTIEVGGQVVYVIDVLADDQLPGCGAPGRQVVFWVGTQRMSPSPLWANGRLWDLPLQPAPSRISIYLPLLVKQGPIR